MASRIPGMACPDLRATEGPEEKDPDQTAQRRKGMERLKVDVQQGDKGAAPSVPRRSPKAGRKWTNSGRKRAVSTSEAPWVEFRDSLLREEYSTHLASTM